MNGSATRQDVDTDYRQAQAEEWICHSNWPAGLTDREVEVLRGITRGLAKKQIAQELHVSQATVHTHVFNLFGKIGVNTRAGATLFAFEHDLVDPAKQ